MWICSSERIKIKQISLADADFFLRLLNDDSFLDNIGDKKVRSVEEAEDYLLQGPLKNYADFGFGLYLVTLHDDTPIGTCGIIKRDELDLPDLGYAFLPSFWHQGFANEAAVAVLAYARDTIGLKQISAIVGKENLASIKVLEKLNFVHKGYKAYNSAEMTDHYYERELSE